MRSFILLACSSLVLSGCVTESTYVGSDRPVVEKKFNNIEAARTRISLALNYLASGDSAQAKFNLDRAAKFAPELPEVHYSAAYYYQQVGEPERARASYQRALSLAPNDPNTLNNYGVFLCDIGDYAGATEQFRKAIAIPSYIRVAESYENLALCAIEFDKFDEAENFLKSAVQHNSQRPSSLINLAALHYAKSDFHHAEQVLKRYQDSGRVSSRSLLLSYLIEERMGHIEKAEKIAKTVEQTYPTSVEARVVRENAYDRSEFEILRNRYRESQLLKLQKDMQGERIVAKPKIKILKKKAPPRREEDVIAATGLPAVTPQLPTPVMPLVTADVRNEEVTPSQPVATETQQEPVIAVKTVADAGQAVPPASASDTQEQPDQASAAEGVTPEPVAVSEEPVAESGETEQAASTEETLEEQTASDMPVEQASESQQPVEHEKEQEVVASAESATDVPPAAAEESDDGRVTESASEVVENAVGNSEQAAEPDTSLTAPQENAETVAAVVEKAAAESSEGEAVDEVAIASEGKPASEENIALQENDTTRQTLGTEEDITAQTQAAEAIAAEGTETIETEGTAAENAQQTEPEDDVVAQVAESDLSAEPAPEALSSEVLAAEVLAAEIGEPVVESDETVQTEGVTGQNETPVAAVEEDAEQADAAASVEKETNIAALTPPYHVVKSGETLYTISRKYNIRMDRLQQWNRIKTADKVRSGSRIYLGNPNIYHKVKSGDTLFSISTRYNVRMEKLREWNHLDDAATLTPGFRLILVDPETQEL